jgi:hypothetical protein
VDSIALCSVASTGKISAFAARNEASLLMFSHTRKIRISPSREALAFQGFHTLSRQLWRKRKGGYTRRMVRRLLIAIYHLVGSPVVANTSCSGALLSGGSSASLSISLPP